MTTPPLPGFFDVPERAQPPARLPSFAEKFETALTTPCAALAVVAARYERPSSFHPDEAAFLVSCRQVARQPMEVNE